MYGGGAGRFEPHHQLQTTLGGQSRVVALSARLSGNRESLTWLCKIV
jgi:hypothetical protein